MILQTGWTKSAVTGPTPAPCSMASPPICPLWRSEFSHCSALPDDCHDSEIPPPGPGISANQGITNSSCWHSHTPMLNMVYSNTPLGSWHISHHYLWASNRSHYCSLCLEGFSPPQAPPRAFGLSSARSPSPQLGGPLYRFVCTWLLSFSTLSPSHPPPYQAVSFLIAEAMILSHVGNGQYIISSLIQLPPHPHKCWACWIFLSIWAVNILASSIFLP